MPQPGTFQPRGEDAFIRRVQDLERTVKELAAANPFGTMGLRPRDGGTEFDGYVTINGPLTVSGESQISGSLSIEGPLHLQPGSVENDALTNPVEIGTASNGINNYAIDTTSTVRATVTLTVPEGFTQAVVTANPTAMGHNSTATPDYLYVMAVVQGISGGELYTSATAGLGAGLAAPFHTTLTGLTGGQAITVGVATRAGLNPWPASTANQANIYATAIFLR